MLSYPPVQPVRNVEVAYTSYAVHPQGLNVFEVQREPSGSLGKGDVVNLTYKKANDGWIFVAERCRITPGEERDHLPYVLLHVPRSQARLGWWPMIEFVIGRPWASNIIPSTVNWQPRSAFPRGRLPIEVRRILEPARPDVEEVCELLRKVPVEVIMEITREDGARVEVARAMVDDADIAI
ncbi:hypothetical protein C2E23DRAFT_739118 [Lenzites betulinus]|nr:hypothetical protein C2E23DRAFT_739118 [Lenzites betulinus]